MAELQKQIASQAESLARRLLSDDALDDRARVVRAYEICFGRPAEEAEVDRALGFVHRLEGEVGVAASVPWPPPEGMADRDRVEIDARHHAWRSLCKVLIASNEFIYVR